MSRSPALAVLFLGGLLAAASSVGHAQSVAPTSVRVNRNLPLIAHPGRTVVFEIALTRAVGTGAGVFYGRFLDPGVLSSPLQRIGLGFGPLDEFCARIAPGDHLLHPPAGSLGRMYVDSIADGQTVICRMRLVARPDLAPGVYPVMLGEIPLQVIVTVPGAHPIPTGDHTPWLLALLLASIAARRLRPR